MSTNKPTSGERIQAFMSSIQVQTPKVWVTAWRVLENGVWTWRATVDHESSDLFRDVKLWRSQFYFEGKSWHVFFYSAHDKFSMDEAMIICDMLVKNKTVKHELILE